MRSKNPRLLFTVAALTIFLSSLIGVAAQSTPSRSLLALSKRNHTLPIVDPQTLQVVARAPVGPDPHEVIASADGKTAYVSIYAGGRYHALSVIDLIGQKALPDIDTGALNGPHGLTFVGGKVWFTAEGAKVIATYDPASAKIDWVMGTDQNRTHMILCDPGPKADLHNQCKLCVSQHPRIGCSSADGASPGHAPAAEFRASSAASGRKSPAHGSFAPLLWQILLLT
jgi:hypothetical protein